jgi:hypothetical protein
MIWVQPTKEKGHVAPEFAVARLGPRTKYTIAIGFGTEQDLLDEEGCGFANHFTGSACRYHCSVGCFFVARRDSKQSPNVVWQGS